MVVTFLLHHYLNSWILQFVFFQILCLQEVQATHLESFYDKFEQIGYCGVYKQKTGHRHDGCAIYYKQNLFHLMDQVSVSVIPPHISRFSTVDSRSTLTLL